MAMMILSTASLKLLANSLDRLFTPSIILTHAEPLQVWSRSFSTWKPLRHALRGSHCTACGLHELMQDFGL
jgi:hypothetical protein